MGKKREEVKVRTHGNSFQAIGRFDLSDGSVKRLTATGKTEDEAKKNLYLRAEKEQDIISYGEKIKEGEVPLTDAVEKWLTDSLSDILPGKDRPRRESTVARDETVYKSLIAPHKAFSETKVKDITANTLLFWREWADTAKNKDKKPYSADSKNRAVYLIKAVIDPYHNRHQSLSPTKVLTRWVKSVKKKTENNVLNEKELKLFLNDCKAHIRDEKYAVAALCLYLFMRPGEVIALKTEDYDKEAHTLHVHRTVSKKKDKDGIVRPHLCDWTKTEDSDRIIPLPPEAIKILDCYSFMKEPTDLLFPTKNGNLISESNFNKWFKRTLKGLGINKNLHAHNLRTSGITFAAMNGADMYGVSAIAGHSDIKTTEKYYTAIYERKKIDAMNKMENAWKGL